MIKRWSLLFGWSVLLSTQAVLAQVSGYTPPTGFRTFSLGLSDGAVAISPSGKMAVAVGRFGGGATITVYDRISPQGRQILATISDSQWQFFGGLAWRDDTTLVFSENGDMDTLFEWDTTTGAVNFLAPQGATPNVADVVIVGNQVLALGADGPNANKLYRVANGSATVLVNAYGTGYAGGLGFQNGLIYAGDTNDPNFVGNPGQVFRFQPTIGNDGLITGVQLVDTLSLAGGGGAGVVSLVFDSEGDLIATTQRTLTLLRGTQAMPFGTFSGSFPFPTSIAYYGSGFEPFHGTGVLIVNARFTEVGEVFAITPVPEPASLGVLSAGLLAVALHKRRRRA
ncbi:MAG: hypothetical protein C4337_05895 [Armatimonadota bacterium]